VVSESLGKVGKIFFFGKVRENEKLVPFFRLECIKFVVRWGSTPDPAGGAYSTPPDL